MTSDCSWAKYIPLTEGDKKLIIDQKLSRAAGDAVIYYDEEFKKRCR